MTAQINILIADDHPIFRGGLRTVIEKEAGLTVVAEADNGSTALELVGLHAPDVAILDLDMPHMDGFAVARALKAAGSRVQIVILTMHKDEMHFNEAVDLGVAGFLIKDGAAAEVVSCIKTVADGKKYFSPVLSSLLLKRAERSSAYAGKPGIGELTPTERRVLYLLADLRTSKEIAADLGVSPRTIENHRAHICSKLDLQGTHALTRFAVKHRNELG